MKFILTLMMCLFLGCSTFAKTTKPLPNPQTIKLTEKNHVLLRGTVDDSSIAQVTANLLKLSAELPEHEIIYLVIDSGGGWVTSGMDMINVMDIVPQKIHTISLYAFSMAYSISQRGDKRYIAQKGIMGQHRARGTFQGQFAYGEVEKRLGLWQKIMIELETYEAKRLGVTLKKFQELIKDEMYVYYTDAVEKKVVDGQVKITCSKNLLHKKVIQKDCNIFACQEIEYSACPLIRGHLPDAQNNE